MSDIVERLRNFADPSKTADCRDTDDMCLQAADEIERLREELAECRRLLREIKTAPMQIGCDSLHVSISTGLYKQIKEAAKAGGDS